MGVSILSRRLDHSTSGPTLNTRIAKIVTIDSAVGAGAVASGSRNAISCRDQVDVLDRRA